MTIRSANGDDLDLAATWRTAPRHVVGQRAEFDPHDPVGIGSAALLRNESMGLAADVGTGSDAQLVALLVACAEPDPVDPSRHQWVLRVEGAPNSGWIDTVPALLAATSGRLRDHAGTGLTVGWRHDDHRGATMLDRSGFGLSCWFRERQVDGFGERDRQLFDVEDDWDGENDLPLPHRHGLTWALAGAEHLRVDQGAAVASPRCRSGKGTFVLADPIVAMSPDARLAAIRTVERHGIEVGADCVRVTVGMGEPRLDRDLGRAGYRQTLDWWFLAW